MKTLLALGTLLLLCGCPPAAAPTCESDAGLPPPADAGAPDYEVQFRFVNLGRETVVVRLDGEDAGQPVPALSSLAKTGHLTLIKQRGSVEARDFLPDGGKQSVLLPFEFPTTEGEPVTFVLRDLTPTQSSMKLSVAKQTQGATFGEKVNQGLAGVVIPGGVDTGGDCNAEFSAAAGTPAAVGLRAEPPPSDQDCPGTADDDFVRPGEVDPESTPYFIRGADGELLVAWVGKVNAGLHAAGGALAQGASLLGGSLPGGAVISAAVRSLYVLNGHGSGMPATVSIDGIEVAKDVAPGALVRVKSSLLAAAARKGLNAVNLRRAAIVGIAVGATVGTFELGSETGPCKPPYLCDFQNGEDTLLVVSENLSSSATVMKSRHDTAKNSVGNIRRQIAFGTTSSLETRGCVAAFEGDNACVMGAAVVPAVASVSNLGGGGGAAAAAYASTGMVLYPPTVTPASGAAMQVGVEESGVIAQRFFWGNPAGLTPVPGKAAGGFAIVASGTVLDATAAAKRALFFVNTGVTPWTVQATLSR